MINKKNILGVGITDASKKEVLEYIIKILKNSQEKRFFVTPNPEFLVLASRNKAFKNILNRADLALSDGVGLMIAARILGRPLRERFTGVDLVESLCGEIAEKPITVGFLGGKHGVAEKAAECLVKKYPGLKVAFVGEEWSMNGFLTRQPFLSDDAWLSNSESQSLASVSLSKIRRQTGKLQPNFSSSEKGLPRPFNNLIVKQFNLPAMKSKALQAGNKTIDILFVAFGAPKQEFWINDNLGKIPVRIAIGVGGAFDCLSGKIPRAPGLIRSIGFEWLFRLVVQPSRIKRQLSLIEFIWLIFKEKLSKS